MSDMETNTQQTARNGVLPEQWRYEPASPLRSRQIYRRNSQRHPPLDGYSELKVSRWIQIRIFISDLYQSTPHPWGTLLVLVTWAVAVAIMNEEDILGANMALDTNTAKTITTILAFLIVFRTNQSVQRWYEGRILWGKLSFACVELTQQAAGWIEDADLARRIMHQAIAFSYAVKQHMRVEQLEKCELEGIVLSPEVDRMNDLKLPAPLYCADVIRECIKKGLTNHPVAFGQQAIARGIDVNVATMTSCFANMSRIKSTPQPACYRTLLHFFTVFYLLLLPVISYDYIGNWIIPEGIIPTMEPVSPFTCLLSVGIISLLECPWTCKVGNLFIFFTSYLMLGLQLAAKDLEDPFGYDLSDLKMDEFCRKIRDHCQRAFFVGCKGGHDLTLPDGGAGAEATLKREGLHSHLKGSGVLYSSNVTSASALPDPVMPRVGGKLSTQRSPVMTSAQRSPVFVDALKSPPALSNSQRSYILANIQKSPQLMVPSNSQRSVALSTGQRSVALSTGQRSPMSNNSGKASNLPSVGEPALYENGNPLFLSGVPLEKVTSRDAHESMDVVEGPSPSSVAMQQVSPSSITNVELVHADVEHGISTDYLSDDLPVMRSAIPQAMLVEDSSSTLDKVPPVSGRPKRKGRGSGPLGKGRSRSQPPAPSVSKLRLLPDRSNRSN